MSTCSSETCIGKETPFRASGIIVLCLFGENINDLSEYANATVFDINPPMTHLSQDYVRQRLYLNQYIIIPYMKQRFT
jgi:hypothetical protein